MSFKPKSKNFTDFRTENFADFHSTSTSLDLPSGKEKHWPRYEQVETHSDSFAICAGLRYYCVQFPHRITCY